VKWEDIYKSLSLANLVIIISVGLCLNLFAEPSFCFGFLIGAIIMLVNFHFMQKNIRSLFIREGFFVGNTMALVSKFYFRLAIIGIIIYILLGKNVDPVGLVLGLSAHIMGIVITGFYYGIRFYKENRKG